MLESLSTLVNNLFTDWVARLFRPWAAIAAWRRHRERVAKDRQQAAVDQQYRAELRQFALAPLREMNEALNALRWEMMNRYTGPTKGSLNELFGQYFEHAIQIPCGQLERLVKAEADLPVIEEPLWRYLASYRAAPAMLRRYMTLSGLIADDALWREWLAADEQCFRAFRKLKALPGASRIAGLSDAKADTKTVAINAPSTANPRLE
jgi:hypothetical protein